jgi:hypothetical protein
VRLSTVCPKCQRERLPGEDACARCGLLVARWEGYAIEEPTHPALDTPWVELEANWQSDEAHQKFLELAAACDGLDMAAARYRKRSLADVTDARAKKGVERAVTMAQTLYRARAAAERPPRAPAILKLVGTMFAGFILIAAVWVLVVALRTRP